jgi:hypothetical protein
MVNALLLITLVILPLTVLLGLAILPPSWNKVIFLVAGLAMVFAWSIFHSSDGDMFGLSVLIKLLQAVALTSAFALGFAIRGARRWWSTRSARQRGVRPPQPEPASEWPGAVFGGLVALSLPVFLSYHGAFGRSDGTTLFSALAIVLIMLIAAAVAGYRLGNRALFVTSVACAVSITAIAAYALKTGSNVQTAARATADGKPFCIQSGNAPVSSVQDLTFLTLRAPQSPYSHSNYHGLLVVKDEDKNLFYNWSYWRGRFLPAHMTYKPDVLCTPG